MTESLGARCRTFSDSSDRSRGRAGVPIAFPAGILLVFTVILLFGALKAQAGLTVRDTNGAQICRFEENGDLYLSGVLVEYGGDTIPSLPAGSDCWRILDSDGSVLLWLFKSEATVGNVTYYPGDMILAGSVSGHSSLTDSSIWRLKDSSGTVTAQLTSTGTLQLRYGTGQQYVSDKVFTNSSLIASIASDRFKFDPGDLDFIANKGDAYTVKADTNPRPTDEYDPEDDEDFPKWYDTTESYHGSGDLWVTTWVKNDSGTPLLLMANGDGYGLSFRPKAGPAATMFAYQKNGSDTLVEYPCLVNRISPAPCWRLLPVIAISRFKGRPGEGNGTNTGYLGWPFDEPLTGPGETIARFLWSDADLVNEFGELVSDVMSTNKIPNEPPLTDSNYPVGFYKKSSEGIDIDSHSHRTPRELKPTGIIHFATGGDGTTYMACHDHNPNHPEEIEDCPGSKDWQPTAAAQHVYIFKSTDQGVTWGPTADDQPTTCLPRLDLASNRRVWTDFKFTTPAFCQFGMGYEDYDNYAFPGETTKYLYAFSPHERWWNQDNLYLGRVAVYYSGGWHTDDILTSGNWSYWVGTDSTGQPIWASSDVSKAAPILHATGEIAQPSVIYHKDSGLYLMATFSNSGRNTLDGWPDNTICHDSLTSTSIPVGGKTDPHWILWQAPKPWGPWKKAFTNDYNGLQTDYFHGDGNPDHDMDRQGFMGYNVQIMPSWTSNSGAGEWSIWVLHAGFVNFFRNLDKLEFEGGTVLLDHPLFGDMDWLEGDYTLEFSQIALSQKTKPISASLSPMYQHEQNDTATSSTAQFTVGYHFTLSDNRTVTHLGRYFVTGNTGTHTLKIVAVTISDSTATSTTTRTSVSLNLGSFTPDQMDEHGFVYVELDTPVQLSANTDYLLLSSEGGSNTEAYFGWASKRKEIYQDPITSQTILQNVLDLPEVSTGRVLQILHAATQESLGNTWTLCNSVSYPDEMYGVPMYGVYGNSFGGVNLLFQRDSVPYAMHSTSWVSSTSAQNECLVGTSFTLQQSVIVSSLGRMKVNGNTKVHEVRLMMETGTTYTTIASVPIRMYSSTENNTYVYRNLATPVRLESGKRYVLVSREFTNENYCGSFSMTGLGNVFIGSAACSFPWSNNSVGTGTEGSPGYCYGGVNLKYY